MNHLLEISQDGGTLIKVLDSSVTHLSIPENIVKVKARAFQNCSNLQSVEINKRISYIPSFIGCKSLHTITVNKDNEVYTSIDGIVYSKDLTKIVKVPEAKQLCHFCIPNTVKIIGSNAFRDCIRIQSVSIPESVKVIDSCAFYGCSFIKSIVIPSGVTIIDGLTFKGTSIETIDIPKSIQKINASAFEDCSSLKEINVDNENAAYCSVDGIVYTKNFEEIVVFPPGKHVEHFIIPDTVKKIGYHALTYCESLYSLEVPGSIKEIGMWSFKGSKYLKNVIILEGVKEISQVAFLNCISLTSISIPKSVHIINDTAFEKCTSLHTINVDENNSEYASVDGILYTKDLSKIVIVPEGKQMEHFSIPDSVKEIGRCAFSRQTHLQTVDIPNSLTTIGGYAFSDCTALQNIKLPEGLEKIEKFTFSGCSSLCDITIPDSVIEIGEDAFQNTIWFNNIKPDNNGFIIINHVLLQYEKAQENNHVVIPHGVRVIGSSVFKNCKSLQSIDIPNSVFKIGKYAFEGCESLQSLDIPHSMKEISDHAFSGCTALDDVDISNSVRKIGNHAFSGCKSIKSIILPTQLKSIEWGTFSGCISLEYVNIPDGVDVIDGACGYYGGAFDGCTSLKSIHIPNSIAKIGNRAFHNSGIETIVIPSSVEWISEHAFCNCPLQSVEVEEDNKAYSSKDGILYSYHELYYHNNSLWYIKGEKEQGVKSLIKYPPQKTEETFVLDKSVTALMSCAFKGAKNLQEIILHEHIVCIGGQQTFAGCTSLKKMVVPPLITKIPEMTFYKCSNLEEITLPKTKNLCIGKEAFYGCSKLRIIHALADVIEDVVIEEAFEEDTYNDCILFIPSGTRWAYKHHPIFGKFKHIEIEK